jgi:hypothetical protein
MQYTVCTEASITKPKAIYDSEDTRLQVYDNCLSKHRYKQGCLKAVITTKGRNGKLKYKVLKKEFTIFCILDSIVYKDTIIIARLGEGSNPKLHIIKYKVSSNKLREVRRVAVNIDGMSFTTEVEFVRIDDERFAVIMGKEMYTYGSIIIMHIVRVDDLSIESSFKIEDSHREMRILGSLYLPQYDKLLLAIKKMKRQIMATSAGENEAYIFTTMPLTPIAKDKPRNVKVVAIGKNENAECYVSCTLMRTLTEDVKVMFSYFDRSTGSHLKTMYRNLPKNKACDRYEAYWYKDIITYPDGQHIAVVYDRHLAIYALEDIDSCPKLVLEAFLKLTKEKDKDYYTRFAIKTLRKQVKPTTARTIVSGSAQVIRVLNLLDRRHVLGAISYLGSLYILRFDGENKFNRLMKSLEKVKRVRLPKGRNLRAQAVRDLVDKIAKDVMKSRKKTVVELIRVDKKANGQYVLRKLFIEHYKNPSILQERYQLLAAPESDRKVLVCVSPDDDRKAVYETVYEIDHDKFAISRRVKA